MLDFVLLPYKFYEQFQFRDHAHGHRNDRHVVEPLAPEFSDFDVKEAVSLSPGRVPGEILAC